MRQPKPIRLLSALAACACLSLLGCDTGLDFDNASLPAASITLAEAPATCSGSGGGSFDFAIDDIIVRDGFGGSQPGNRLEVSGSVSGIGMDDNVVIVTFTEDFPCPLVSSANVTVTDGAFVAIVDYEEQTAFRAALVAHAGLLDEIDCAIDADCLSTAVGSFSAVSQTIEVRLR